MLDASPATPATLTLPTALTLARMAAVPALVAILMLVPGETGRWLALALFLAAAATDWLDGYLARRWNQQSQLGAMLDPIADKLIVATALVMLIADATLAGVHVIAVIVILAREILVSGVREVLAADGVGMPVSQLAKWKTAAQMAAIAALLAAPAPSGWMPALHVCGLALLWIAAALTLQTGASYLSTAVRHLTAAPNNPPPDEKTP